MQTNKKKKKNEYKLVSINTLFILFTNMQPYWVGEGASSKYMSVVKLMTIIWKYLHFPLIISYEFRKKKNCRYTCKH